MWELKSAILFSFKMKVLSERIVLRGVTRKCLFFSSLSGFDAALLAYLSRTNLTKDSVWEVDWVFDTYVLFLL